MAASPRFSDDELRRYSRQMLLREVGGRGQERLRSAAVVLRCGRDRDMALIAARYLLRAGLLQLRLRGFGDQAAALAADAPPGWCGVMLDDDDVSDVTWVDLPPPLPPISVASVEARGADGHTPFTMGAALALEVVQRLLGLPASHEMPTP